MSTAQSTAGWQRIDCPVCDGSEFAPLFERAGEPFVRCRGCGLVLINPRRAAAAIAARYDAGYTDRYLRKADKKRRRCRSAVRRVQQRYVRAGRWLDVGCSAGYLVEAAQDAGFEAWGVDVEPAGVTHARERLGLARVHCGTLEALALPARAFDVISAWDVIEHVPDVDAFAAELARLLAPGGIIEIRTPDVAHFRRPRRLEAWSEIKPSEHLYYFSRATLARLLARHGLAIVHRRPAWKPALKVYVRHLAALARVP